VTVLRLNGYTLTGPARVSWSTSDDRPLKLAGSYSAEGSVIMYRCEWKRLKRALRVGDPLWWPRVDRLPSGRRMVTRRVRP